MAIEIISEYWSYDGKLKAEVVLNKVSSKDRGVLMLQRYEDGKFIGSAIYPERDLSYYEIVAEDYVLGA